MAKSLVQRCLDVCARMGVRATRMQAGVIMIGGRWVHSAKRGWLDIVCYTRTGRFVAIECKDGQGELSREQLERMHDMLACGCVCILVSAEVSRSEMERIRAMAACGRECIVVGDENLLALELGRIA